MIIIEIKICTKCSVEFPATSEYFHKKKTGKYGLMSICKKCKNKANRLYKKNNSEKLKEQSKKYYINNAEEIRQKHIEYSRWFYKNNSNKIRLYRSANLVHFREYRRKYDKTLKGRELKSARVYKREGLMWLNGGSYTPEQWEECLLYFDNRCAYTGELLKSDNIHVEHIKPISKEGTSYIWNICPSIGYANLSKNDNGMNDWFRKQTYFSEKRLEKIYAWVEYAKFLY